MTPPARITPRPPKDVPLAAVRAVFEDGEPMLTEEIEERFGLRYRAAVDKLEQLHERGVLDRKQIGDRLVVWWMPGAPAETPPSAVEEVIVAAHDE